MVQVQGLVQESLEASDQAPVPLSVAVLARVLGQAMAPDQALRQAEVPARGLAPALWVAKEMGRVPVQKQAEAPAPVLGSADSLVGWAQAGRAQSQGGALACSGVDTQPQR